MSLYDYSYGNGGLRSGTHSAARAEKNGLGVRGARVAYTDAD